MASDRDLVADARAMTDRLRADDIDPRDRVISAARNLLTELADKIAALQATNRALIQRHSWECLNRTRIGVPELDACDCPEGAADAKARGWRPPPPEIADPAELDKLPGRSIVVGTRGTHGGLAYQLTSWDGFTNAPNWASAYDTEDRTSSRQVIRREGSVIVLYVPTPGVRP